MGWIITCLVLLALLLLSKKASAGITNMQTNKTETLNDIIEYNAKEFSIPTALIKAVIKKESNWNPYAKNPSDPSYGLMQIMPIAAQDAGIISDYKNVSQADIDKIMSPQNNIRGGCFMLHRLMKKYEIPVAVEMYNVGERGYNELGRRNGFYRKDVLEYYQNYLDEEAGV